MTITRFFSPLHVGLFENRIITEYLYDNALPAKYVEAINETIRSHLLACFKEEGLIDYFSNSNKGYAAFVKAHVKYIRLYAMIMDGSLHLVAEIGADSHFPENIQALLMDDMKNEYKNGFGQEMEELDIYVPDAALYEPDSLLGLRNDFEQRHPDYQFRTLDNPSLGLHVYDSKWFKMNAEVDCPHCGKTYSVE